MKKITITWRINNDLLVVFNRRYAAAVEKLPKNNLRTRTDVRGRCVLVRGTDSDVNEIIRLAIEFETSARRRQSEMRPDVVAGLEIFWV